MSFSDLINQDIIDIYNGQTLHIGIVIFDILMAFLLSLIILFTYRNSYQTTVYNRSFAVGLPVVSMITSVIIISVASNIILSLGMVGALSIVRFRTALKNPFDTVFMFWAIGLGIIIGAGLIWVAIISTIVIAVAVLLLIKLEILVSSYFVIIRAEDATKELEILAEVNKIFGRYTLKNKTVRNNHLDLTLEVRSRDDRTAQVNSIQNIPGVHSVIILSHNGDYISE